MTFRAMWETTAWPWHDYSDHATEAEAHKAACELIRGGVAAVKVWEIEGEAG